MSALPGEPELFERYFARSYSERDRARREQNRAAAARRSSPFEEQGRAKIRRQLDGMAEAARQDWGQLTGSSGRLDLDWLAAFEQHWDEGRIAWLLERASPDNSSNDYVILCCELGAALGVILAEAAPRLAWCEELPYWESVLVADGEASGETHEVFRWARQRLSGTGLEGGLMGAVQRVTAPP